MKIRPLFQKYQKPILAFANTSFGKDYLGIKTQEKIVKLTPDSWHTQIKKNTFIGRFYSCSPYLEKFRLALESMEIVEEVFNFRKVKEGLDFVIPHYLGFTQKIWLPKIYFLTKSNITFVSDANPETTTVDGTIGYSDNNGQNWATIHDATAGTYATPSGTADYALRLLAHGSTSGYYIRLARSFYLYDTSSIPTNAIISAGTFTFYSDSGDPPTAGWGGSMNLVSSTPASNTDLVVGDYDQLGSTSFGSMNISAVVNDSSNNFSLNATGLAAITKGGITKFGVRQSNDMNNSEPSWVGNTTDDVYVRLADYGSNKPTLTLTYSYFAQPYYSV